MCSVAYEGSALPITDEASKQGQSAEVRRQNIYLACRRIYDFLP
jgi:hypothetical protein